MVNLQSLINMTYPNRLQRWLSPIPEDLDTLNSSATMMNLGYTQAGVQLLIQALLLSPQPKAIWAASELLRKRWQAPFLNKAGFVDGFEVGVLFGDFIGCY